MWEQVGLDGIEERVYRAMVGRLSGTAGDLAAELDLEPSAVAGALDRLSAAGLAAAVADGGFAAIDPRVGLGTLIRRHRIELDRIQYSADLLADEFRETRLRDAPGSHLEVVRGADAIALRVADLLTGTGRELLALVAPPFLDPEDDSLEPMEELLRRGVRCRALHAVEMLGPAAGLAQARRLAAAGEEIRVLPEVPLKLLVSDRRRALLPLSSQAERTAESALVIRDSALLDALVALFDALWAKGTPFEEGGPEGDGVPDQELLALLALGLKDEAIARHLGISERSLRRRTSALLAELSVSSRFQAGLVAARRGWL